MLTFTDDPVTELREGMTFADYCAFPALNQSKLKDFDYDLEGCPALYRFRCVHPDARPESEALAVGRRYHSYLLEPNSFERHYAVLTPDTEAALLETARARGSKATEFSTRLSTYAAFETACRDAGREVVSVKQAAELQAMREAVVTNAEIMDAVGFGKTEVSAFCSYRFGEGSGFEGRAFQLKARFDLLPGGDALVDLKTCRTADPIRFANQVFALGYDIQAAFYVDAARRNKLDIRRFGFLAQDKFPPYLPCVHWMPAEWLGAARIRYQGILLRIAGCITTDRWPGRRSEELVPPFRAQLEIDAVAA